MGSRAHPATPDDTCGLAHRAAESRMEPWLYIEAWASHATQADAAEAATHTCDMTALLNCGKKARSIPPSRRRHALKKKKQLHEPRDHVIQGVYEIMRKRENGRAKKTKKKQKSAAETTCCVIRTGLRYGNWANEEEKCRCHCRCCCSSARMTKGLPRAVLAPD